MSFQAEHVKKNKTALKEPLLKEEEKFDPNHYEANYVNKMNLITNKIQTWNKINNELESKLKLGKIFYEKNLKEKTSQQEKIIAQDAKLINKLLKDVEEIQNYEIASKISKLRKASLEELDRYRKLISDLTSLNYENMKNMNLNENEGQNQNQKWDRRDENGEEVKPEMLMQLEYNQNVINDRQDDLNNINQFVLEVKDLMVQTADTVLNQGEVVDLISTNIETTKKNTDGAQKQISEANESSKNMRKYIYWIVGIIVVVVLILIITLSVILKN